MKRFSNLPAFSCAAAATALFLMLRTTTLGQENSLEDAPYQPSPSVVKGTVAAVSDRSPETAALAVRTLADWKQAEAAPEIAKHLGADTSTGVRLEALRYFTRLGPKGKQFLPEVLKQAGDADPNVRGAVLNVVFESQASAECVAPVSRFLNDPRGDVRVAAARCLGQAGKAAAPYRQALFDALNGSGTDDFRATTIRALGDIGGLSAEEIDLVRPQLRNRDAEVRIAAWGTFLKAMAAGRSAGTISAEKSATARAELAPLFKLEPPEVKAGIIEECKGDKTAMQAYVPDLVEQIRTGPSDVQETALRALGKAGDEALEQVPLILAQVKSPNANVRAGAIAALGSLGPAAVKPNVPIIANALLDDSDSVRDEALQALPAGGEAVANFPYRIEDVYPKASAGVRAALVRSAAVRIRNLGMTEENSKRCQAALADADPDIRRGASFVVGQIGPKLGGALLPNLVALVNDPEPTVRGAALIALRAFAADAANREKLRGAVRPLLKDGDAKVRWAALDTLHELEPGREPALVDEIAALLKDEDETVRNAAVRALGAAGAAAKPHLTDMVRFFLDDPAVPPYAAARCVLEVSPLKPQELTCVLYPLYVYPEQTALNRVAAYGASGGDRDGLLIVRLLGRTRTPAKEIVSGTDKAHAIALLEDALKAPLLHDQLKTEIQTRLSEISALR